MDFDAEEPQGQLPLCFSQFISCLFFFFLTKIQILVGWNLEKSFFFLNIFVRGKTIPFLAVKLSFVIL